MRLCVIGAGGFVGQMIARRASNDSSISELVLCDTAIHADVDGATLVRGSFADAEIRAKAVDGADAVILLASVLGGAAEADYSFARSINIDASLDLIGHLKNQNPSTRFVFASSIAVFAHPLPNPVIDTTPTDPSMVYGAQKLMMEVAISNFAKKGWLDGISLRLSGVVARDGADKALKAAFLSRVFWAVKRGEDIVLPVSPAGTTWLISNQAVADNFLHAAATKGLGPRRAVTLPALCLTFNELVETLKAQFPESKSRVEYEPDDEMMALFGSYPELETKIADEMGFVCDQDAETLVRNALEEH